MRRLVLAIGVVALALTAFAVSGGTAVAAQGGNSANAHACQKDGWQLWVRADQTPFANQDECVSYGAQGGTLTVPLPVPPAVLARAWTDLVVDGVFTLGDAEIARLEDTNRDGVVSVGDRVVMSRYPTSFGPSFAFGTFGVTSHVVSNVVVVGPFRVDVDTVGGARLSFDDGTVLEEYRELVGGSALVRLADSFSTLFSDLLGVSATAPSQPSTPVSLMLRTSPTDDAFLEVDITL
jgi:hypothetical protein